MQPYFFTEQEPKMIANVILTDSSHAIDRIFDYKIPEEFNASAVIGRRVLVPFGNRNASAEGLIVALSETSDYKRLKPILQCLDEYPICSEETVRLCFSMQSRYLCSFQQAYKLVKPPHLNTNVHSWLVYVKESDTKLTKSQELLLNTLKEFDGVAELDELEAHLNKRSLKQSAYALKDMGLIDIREKIGSTISVKFIRTAQLCCSVEEGYTAADELRAKRSPVQADMLLTLCDCGDMPTYDLVAVSGGNYTSLRGLCDKGYICINRIPAERSAYNEEKYAPSSACTPTAEQKPIIEHLKKLISHNMHEDILLHGVTGSGKTEVFLQAIAYCIKSGKQAIMLVPEISLTPQMVERFVSRFGTSVAVMHSGLSQGERFDQWHKIKRGEVNVVVGARSAIFAPFDNIGIIILDEEHETSYKSETSPRYHARDIAVWRGKKHGAPVLLASATPSISSYYRAKQGLYKLFEMHNRYNNNPLPQARIVDMRSELFDYHNSSAISIRLQDELRRNLERKEKSILFLNRRGYNTFVSCRECGYVMECKNCSIALTYHIKTNKLVCHYCGYTHDNVDTCPECGSKYIKFFGTGTQKIEDELHSLLPEARILRMDFDTTSGKGGHEAILDRFKNGEADILLGTQMVTKGLDFPDVTLVGVLAADSSLNIDDYRANERSFALITQVCGRAGRGQSEGRAVIQTYQPENQTIKLAKEQDYTGFYENEIKYRSQMLYPPFCDIVYILTSGTAENDVKTEITNISGIIRENIKPENSLISIIGPAPAPVAKIKNNFRYRMLLKVSSAGVIMPLLRYINDAHNAGGGSTSLIIDINPGNML